MEQQEDVVLMPGKRKKMRSDFLKPLQRSREEKEREKNFLPEEVEKEMRRGVK